MLRLPHRRWLLSSAFAATASLVVGEGRAQAPAEAPLPVAIEIVTVPECPADRFRTALQSRVRRSFEVREGAAAALRVTIAGRTKDELEGRASFKGASGDASRAVRGSCDEITAALGLVAATWLEAEPSRAAESPPPTIPAEPTPLDATPSVAPPPAPPPSSGEPPAVVADRGRPAERPPAPSPRRPKRLSLGAHGLATFGLVGNPAGGAGLALAYETERFELRGGLRFALSSDTLPSGESHYAWVSIPLDGCGHVLTSQVVRLAGCVRVEPGYFHVSFANSDRSLAWLGVGLGARVGWGIGPIRLEVEGTASLPVTGYRVSRSDVTLVPFRAVAPGLAAGIMVPFW